MNVYHLASWASTKEINEKLFQTSNNPFVYFWHISALKHSPFIFNGVVYPRTLLLASFIYVQDQLWCVCTHCYAETPKRVEVSLLQIKPSPQLKGNWWGCLRIIQEPRLKCLINWKLLKQKCRCPPWSKLKINMDWESADQQISPFSKIDTFKLCWNLQTIKLGGFMVKEDKDWAVWPQNKKNVWKRHE